MRKVEVDDRQLFRLLRQRRAVKRRCLPIRKHHGNYGHEDQPQGPQAEQDCTDAPGQTCRIRGTKTAQSRDQRDDHVWQHGHLHQANERHPDRVEYGGALAEEKPGEYPERQCDEHLRSEADSGAAACRGWVVHM